MPNFLCPKFSKNFDGLVNMTIVDHSGRVLATVLNTSMDAGNHEIIFDGTRLKAGIYLCILEVTSGSRHEQKVLRLVKM